MGELPYLTTAPPPLPGNWKKAAFVVIKDSKMAEVSTQRINSRYNSDLPEHGLVNCDKDWKLTNCRLQIYTKCVKTNNKVLQKKLILVL